MCFRQTFERELDEEGGGGRSQWSSHIKDEGKARTAEKSVVFPASGAPVRATTGVPPRAPFPAREDPSGEGVVSWVRMDDTGETYR